jgi:nucleoside-diphosphate-sugar epimerase
MKILIVGGNSNLGKCLKSHLSKYHTVITAGLKDCDIFLDMKFDVAQNGKIFNALTKADIVVNTSSLFGGASFEDIVGAEIVNVIAPISLCNVAVNAGVKHFVHVGSMFSKLTTDSPYCNTYSITKNSAERLIQYYCHKNNLPYTIIRPSQIYGDTFDFAKHQPFFYDIMENAKDGRDIVLTSDPLRNYIHVEDVVKSIALAIERNVYGSYDCSQISNVSYSQIAHYALKHFETNGSVILKKSENNISDNIFPFEDNLYKQIGFYPEINISAGIKRIAEKIKNS